MRRIGRRSDRAARAYRGGMGVLGEMFPGRKITDESTEAGDGQEHFQLGPIDLDNRTVQVQRVVADEPEQDGTARA